MKKVLLALMVGMLACAACEKNDEMAELSPEMDNNHTGQVVMQASEGTMWNIQGPSAITDPSQLSDQEKNTASIINNAELLAKNELTERVKKVDFETQSVVTGTTTLAQTAEYKGQELVSTPEGYNLNIYVEVIEPTFYICPTISFVGVYPKLVEKPFTAIKVINAKDNRVVNQLRP